MFQELLWLEQERLSGVGPFFELILLKVFEAWGMCPCALISIWMNLALFIINFVFEARPLILHFVQALTGLSTRAYIPAVSQQERQCNRLISYFCYSLIAQTNLSIIFFQTIRDNFQVKCWRGGVKESTLVCLLFCSGPFLPCFYSFACTYGLVTELLNGTNDIYVDTVLQHDGQ